MCLGRMGDMVTERGMWRHGVETSARDMKRGPRSETLTAVSNVRLDLDRASHLVRQLCSSTSPTSRSSLCPITWSPQRTTCGPRCWQDNKRTSTLSAWSLPTPILSRPHPTPRSTYRSPAKDTYVHADQHFHFMLAALRSAHNEYTS